MVEGTSSKDKTCKQPWGLRWRSSVGFVTLVVTLGLFTDILIYSLIIPVIPFQLEALGYDGIGAKISWLLVALTGTLVLATPPIAHYSEVYHNRKIPLLAGLITLIGSQVMFMEAPTYWLMILARFFQGISSTVVWTVGLALLCDTVPKQSLGRQLGIAFTGVTIGNLVAPPVAGILYQRWGFRAPFVFGIIFTGIDFLARLLLVERHEAMRWGVDPMAVVAHDKERDPEEALPEVIPTAEGVGYAKTVLPHIVLFGLMKSSRAVVCILLSLIWGFEWVAQEITVVLHMNRIWGLDSHQAGIAFIAAIVPTIFSGLLSGRLGDKYGSAPVGCAILLLSLPWYGLLTIDGPLAVFLVFFALEAFFVSGLIPILLLELSSVGATMENIGYAHTYGALTLAYGIGTTVGSIVAGQMYDHITRGWFAIELTVMGSMSVGFVLALFMLGERPLGLRLFQRQRR